MKVSNVSNTTRPHVMLYPMFPHSYGDYCQATNPGVPNHAGEAAHVDALQIFHAEQRQLVDWSVLA
jgi:hypothetical protein